MVTEPFSEWVLSGEFKNGRPQWETMGAQFVEDIDPSEDRKLFLLNGSHSLMAYSGSVLGYETIFDAIQDPVIRGWVNAWWDEAVTVIDLPAQELADYRAALLDRYLNPKIKHLLKQIAMDGSQKVPIRTVPTLKAVAATTGGAYHQASDAAQLGEVLRGIPREVVLQREDLEVTAYLAILAALVVAGALVLSVRWNPLA